jgi:hypothetical protein
VGYISRQGRKPFERASKISHGEIINSPEVQTFLTECRIPEAADPVVVQTQSTRLSLPDESKFKLVVAIDGGFREVPVREEFPAATITFFTFGPLLLKLSDLAELDEQPFIAPEDLVKLKNIDRYTLVLPTRNISRRGRRLKLSVRETLQEFFLRRLPGEPPLMEALRFVIFRGWVDSGPKVWTIPSCPNEDCDNIGIELTPSSPDERPCPKCGGPIFMIDAFRLHERVDEQMGAGGILSYVMTLLEQMVLVHLVKVLWDTKPILLRDILFVKDGPLAFFGQTSPLCRPMRELARFLKSYNNPAANGGTVALLNVVGVEKSGPFVEHAAQIADRLDPGYVLVLTNNYIYRYVIPGDPESEHPYGKNTYWGGKLIYKAADGNLYVCTIPTGEFEPSPTVDHFPNLAEILSVVAALKCSMYENALVPVALVNKLVSLADYPSARILETFAKGQIA